MFHSGVNAFDEDQKRELRRLATALRGLVDSSVALTAPLPELAALADGAEALAARAAAFAGERPFPGMRRRSMAI